MAAVKESDGAGYARYTYRLRVSSTAWKGLLGEWDRCRWVWNECVARSKKAHADREECGPARLYRMLTGARAVTPWLAEGASVPQQQLIRDFGKSRTKALKDIFGTASATGTPRSSSPLRSSRCLGPVGYSVWTGV